MKYWNVLFKLYYLVYQYDFVLVKITEIIIVIWKYLYNLADTDTLFRVCSNIRLTLHIVSNFESNTITHISHINYIFF